MTETPGQLACIAWNAHYAEQHGIEARNEWAASDPRGRGAWEAAAEAVTAPLREQLRLARAGREQVRAALAVSNADLGREREQVRLADQDRNQLRKAVLSLAAALEDEGAEYDQIVGDGEVRLLAERLAAQARMDAARLREIAGPPS